MIPVSRPSSTTQIVHKVHRVSGHTDTTVLNQTLGAVELGAGTVIGCILPLQNTTFKIVPVDLRVCGLVTARFVVALFHQHFVLTNRYRTSLRYSAAVSRTSQSRSSVQIRHEGTLVAVHVEHHTPEGCVVQFRHTNQSEHRGVVVGCDVVVHGGVELLARQGGADVLRLHEGHGGRVRHVQLVAHVLQTQTYESAVGGFRVHHAEGVIQ